VFGLVFLVRLSISVNLVVEVSVDMVVGHGFKSEVPICLKKWGSPFLPLPALPSLSFPLLPFSSPSGAHLLNSARGSGEWCELPQWVWTEPDR